MFPLQPARTPTGRLWYSQVYASTLPNLCLDETDTMYSHQRFPCMAEGIEGELWTEASVGMCNDFFAFAPNVNGHETLKSFPPFSVRLSSYTFLYPSLLHRNIKPGILEGLRGVMLRFSLLPFTGLFPILFLSASSSYPLITIYRLLVRSNAQYAYLYAARLLMHSALTHAQ